MPPPAAGVTVAHTAPAFGLAEPVLSMVQPASVVPVFQFWLMNVAVWLPEGVAVRIMGAVPQLRPPLLAASVGVAVSARTVTLTLSDTGQPPVGVAVKV